MFASVYPGEFRFDIMKYETSASFQVLTYMCDLILIPMDAI